MLIARLDISLKFISECALFLSRQKHKKNLVLPNLKLYNRYCHNAYVISHTWYSWLVLIFPFKSDQTF